MPGTIAERTTSRRRAGEIEPLTAEQSDQLASLYEEYGQRMVRYAYSQITSRGPQGSAAWTLAEDISQKVWMQVAREGGKGALLGGEPLTADSPRALLFWSVKQAVSSHFWRRSSGEQLVDWADPVTCNKLCPLMPSGCAMVELPAYLAEMVDELPEEEREALLLMLDGLDPRVMAERLGCSASTAERRANAAVVLLQIDHPELSGEPVALESLPNWEQRALAELHPARREALLRLESVTRQALLLKHLGLGKEEIGKRLGLSCDVTASVTRCVSALRAPGAPTAPKRRVGRRRAPSKFAQVADALREDIRSLRPGDRLPTRKELMGRFGVGSRTIDNAWAVLRGEGLIEPNGIYGYTVARSQTDMEQAA
ncbi:sigma factor-like helix-turn-helix DNA-binding protein [Streptomyces noursei]|uniref:sigma factor-like helix-turn-helix DNA-binding protein n=1 Tax=Streptomyces noursei TaxID=1971 RepID=UPI00380BF649